MSIDCDICGSSFSMESELVEHLYKIKAHLVIAKDMLGILERLEAWGCTEDKMFATTRETKLAKLIADAQTVLHRAKVAFKEQ